MGKLIPIVWTHGGSPCGGGCGGCVPSPAGVLCRTEVTGEPCHDPEMSGLPEKLREVLMALDRDARDPDSGSGIVERHWVKALRIDAGEAELTLAFPAHGERAQELADAAFRAMVRVLPDTDIEIGEIGGELVVNFFCHSIDARQSLEPQAPAMAGVLAERLQRPVCVSVGSPQRDEPGRTEARATP